MTNPNQLLHDLHNFNPSTIASDDQLRTALLTATRSLTTRLERPWDALLRMIYMEPTLLLTIKIACDLQLFTAVQNIGPKTPKQLAQHLCVSPGFLERVCRQLAAGNVLATSSEIEGGYTSTLLAAELAEPGAAGAVTFILETSFPFFARIPGALRERGYDTSGGLWKHASGNAGGQSYYEWLNGDQERLGQFNGMVQGFAASRQAWTEVYPTEQLFADGDEGNGTVLVDVGGGAGGDIEEFLRKHPDSKGRLILQDLAEVVDAANVDEGIEKQHYDFFDEQPVKGARAYFLHSVLHNWSDGMAVEILEKLKPALKKGEEGEQGRKVLIMDVVLPEGPQGSALGSALDMRMLWNFGAGERTERDWRRLVESAGLQMVKVWWPLWEGASIIECGL